jgi:hypothetical protein
MEIRPKERDGLIFSATGRRFAEDCLILDMNDGQLELRYVRESTTTHFPCRLVSLDSFV